MTVISPAATKYDDNFQSHLRFDAAATAKELEKLNKYAHTQEVIEGKFLPFAIEATGWTPLSYGSKNFPYEIADCLPLGLVIPFNNYKHASVLSIITKFNAKMALHH